MSLLDGFRVAQVGPGLAASVSGRLLADVGAIVARIDPDLSSPLAEHLNRGATAVATEQDIATADLIICEGSPATLRQSGRDPDTMRRLNPGAAIVLISPFGQTGPRAEEPATDPDAVFSPAASPAC